MASRAQRTLLSQWWWTVDKVILFSLFLLMITGLVLLMAGGPPVSERLGLSTFHFVHRQIFYLIPAIGLMITTSLLSPRLVRRAALVVYGISMVLIVLTLNFGPEIKGAHRWISIAGFGIQPSEFVKPAFVIIAAYLFSEASKRSEVPATLLALLLLPVTITPLMMQPDFGQTMLITLVWGSLFFVAGLHWIWVLGFGGAAGLGVLAAYNFMPHVRHRIERFMDKSSGDTFQVDTALDSFAQGSWFGKGPGEGTVKRILPDAHTDFIFSVTAEEFGILICLALLSIFAFIVLRGLYLARRNEEPFERLAISGLVTMFGLQAGINMAVNVHLIPAKGMTLPFISFGGSSSLSLALAMGFLIALTRRRPQASLYKERDEF